MGLSRRIKYKYKFVQKYKTNVYQLFTKKNFVRDLFVFKFFSRLFRFEAYSLERKLEKLMCVEKAKNFRTRQNVAIVCFRVNLRFLLVLWQLCLIFGLFQKEFSKFFVFFCLFRSKKQNQFSVFYLVLLQFYLFSHMRLLSFFYFFGVFQGFLKFLKIEFFHMKGFLKKITQHLKKKFRFSSRVFFSGRSRFDFLPNKFSKNRGFVFKNKKKTLYLRKLEKYLHRFAIFKKLYVTFFEKKVKAETSQPIFNHKVAHFKRKQNKHRFQYKFTNSSLVNFGSKIFKDNGNFKSFRKKHWRNNFRFNSTKKNTWSRGKHKKPFWITSNNLKKFKGQNFTSLSSVSFLKKVRNHLKLKKQNVWKNAYFCKDKRNFRKRKLFFVFRGYKTKPVSAVKKSKIFKKGIILKKTLYKTFFNLRRFYLTKVSCFPVFRLFFPNLVLVKRKTTLNLPFFIWQKFLFFYSTKQNKRMFFDIKESLHKVFFNLPIFSKINLVKPLRKFYLLEEPLLKFYKVSSFFKLKKQNWIESYFRFSSLYKNSFKLLHLRFNSRLFKLEARLLTGFVCKIVKFLVFCPFVKSHSKVLQKRRFWKMLTCLLTKKIKDLVFINLKVKNSSLKAIKQDRFFTDSFYTNKFKLPLKIFEFFNQKTSFLFGRFFTRLVKRYGGKRDFLSKIPFRLDIPFQNRKLKKKTEKHERFQHLKIIRRHYGNLTRKQMSKYRKISFVKNKGSAFFNSILLLESRIDFFATKCNFFNPIFDTRNFVFHGFLIVNGKQQTNINFRVDFGDIVSVISSFMYKYRFYFTSKFIHNLYGEGGHVLLSKIFPKYLALTSKAIKCCYLPWIFSISLITENFFIEKVLSENNGRFYYVTI